MRCVCEPGRVFLALLGLLASATLGCAIDPRDLTATDDASEPGQIPIDSGSPGQVVPDGGATPPRWLAGKAARAGSGADNGGAGGEQPQGAAGAVAPICCPSQTDGGECAEVADSCNTPDDERVAPARAMLRIAVRSAAFLECMNTTMRLGSDNGVTLSDSVASGGCAGFTPAYAQTGYGPYVSCKPDPDPQNGGELISGEVNGDAAWNDLFDRQLARVLNALQVDVELAISVDAAAGPVGIQNGYDPQSARSEVDYADPGSGFTFEQLVGAPGDGLGFIPSIVQQTLHNLGYDNGCDRADPPRGTDHGNCGRDPLTWHPDRSLNSIAAFCAKEVLLRSASDANAGCGRESSGALQTLRSCPQDGMMIVSRYDSANDEVACQCVPDPQRFGRNGTLDEFGAALAAGDFNKDGYDDLAVGAPNDRANGATDRGTVFIYRGSRLGLLPWRSFGSAELELDGSLASRCGAALASGDFNGDGVADLAVGCPGFADAGQVAIVPGCALGCDEGLDGLQLALARLPPRTVPGEFGYALAAGRLLGNDALDDLAVGSPAADAPLVASGRVDLYEGRAGAELVHPVVGVPGLASAERFGAALAIGDVQSTRGNELIVGAPEHDSVGAVYVVSPDGTLPIEAPTMALNARFGSAIAAGNVLGDSFADLWITAPGDLRIYRSTGASERPAAAIEATLYRGGEQAEVVTLVPDTPYSWPLIAQPGAHETILYDSTGGILNSGRPMSLRARPFWSAPHDRRDGGHCSKLHDTEHDVPCAIDEVSLAATGLGSALALGDFGMGRQIAMGTPHERVGVTPRASGAVYVREGTRGDDREAGVAIDPLEYRIDQESTFYSGAYDARVLGPPHKFHEVFCLAGETCMPFQADLDGRADLITFTKLNAGVVYFARSTPYGSTASEVWTSAFCPGQEVCTVGDVDGDGIDNLIAFVQSATPGHENHVHVEDSRGATWREWSFDFCHAGSTCSVADVNDDGRADIVEIDSAGVRQIGISTGAPGTGFETINQVFSSTLCTAGENCQLGDVDGDRKADIVAFAQTTTHEVWVALSDGAGFAPPRKWHGRFCMPDELCRVGDMNGDRLADIVAFVREATPGFLGNVWVALSNGHDFGFEEKWHSDLCRDTQLCQLADVTADRRADVVIFTLAPTNDALVAPSNRY